MHQGGRRAARDLGIGPFLRPGSQIDWRCRKPNWQTGDASNIAPMRVVRDDERGLVAWLAAGTPWSVWLFWSEASGADWAFAGWCVNLENAEWSIPQLSDLPR